MDWISTLLGNVSLVAKVRPKLSVESIIGYVQVSGVVRSWTWSIWVLMTITAFYAYVQIHLEDFTLVFWIIA